MGMVNGVVEAKSKTQYGYGIMVNGKWHNSKYEIKCEKGDTVEFDDGDKNYCRKLKVVSSGGGAASVAGGKPAAGGGFSKGTFPIGVRDGQRSIIRQNALTNAREYYCHLVGGSQDLDNDVDTIIHIARKFEAYTTGDMDMEEVQKKMGGFNPED